MAQNIVNVCLEERCICCCWVVFHKCQLCRSNLLVVLLRSSITLLIFCLLVLLITKRGVLLSISWKFCMVMLHVFCGFVTRCINIMVVCLWFCLGYLALYHYAMIFFTPGNILCFLKSIDINIANSAFWGNTISLV